MRRCIGQGVCTYAKIIVSGETSDEDIGAAVQLVADIAPDTPFIIQPMTPFGPATNPPTSRQLLIWQEAANEKLHDVRVIPQCHKMMGQL